MFFVISKLVESLLLPSNIVGVFALFGLVMLVLRRRRLGVGALAVSATLLLAFGWAPVGAAGVLVLENRFPQPRIEEPITGVIMLGGAVDTHISADRRAAALNEGAERLTATAALARLHPQAKIFLSGGANHLLQSQPLTESRIARELLVAIGVPPDRIFSEELSRTTLENGARSAEALKPVSGERWLLVTSASQMPRAVASFRAAGFAVIPYPVDYRTQGSADLSRPTRSISEGLELSDLAAHEWVGLLAYWALGRTNEAFPTADEAIER